MKTKKIIVGDLELTISKFTMGEIGEAVTLYNDYKTSPSIEAFRKIHDLTVDLVLSSLRRADPRITRDVVDAMDPEEAYQVMAAIVEFSTPRAPSESMRLN